MDSLGLIIYRQSKFFRVCCLIDLYYS